MKRLPLLMLVIAAAVFTSCQKEVDGDIPGGREEQTKKYISKFIQYDSGYPGEASVLLFEYDAQKRCVRMREQSIDTVGGVGQISDESSYDFHYSGNDTRPSKVVRQGSLGDATVFFKYDAQGKKLQDSAIDDNGYVEIVNYSYGNNKIFADFTLDYTGTVISYRDTVEFTGENITRHSWGHYQDGGLVVLYEEKYTFDDKLNPFMQLNIGTSFFASAYLEFGTFLGLNKNNFVTVIQKDLLHPVPDVWNAQYKYKYDGDGYPTLVEFNEVGGQVLAGTARYEYLP